MSPSNPSKKLYWARVPAGTVPTPLGLIHSHFLWLKPVKIDKQTLTTSKKHESEPMEKLYRAREPAGIVPDACRVNSGPFILLKPVKIDV
jgi:hypothetical protein